MSNKKEKLSHRREAFCRIFTSLDKEMFGNGVQSYIEVYSPDTSKTNWYKTACQSAYQILSNIDVTNRINELLAKQGFNDENVDRQHLFLINQHVDLKTKMSAIQTYHKLKGKYVEKVDLTTKGESLNQLSDEQKDRIAQEHLRRQSV